MSQARKITVTLDGTQADALYQAVAAGEYSNADAVINEAIEEWQSRRAVEMLDASHLKNLWEEGLASGAAAPLDFSEVRAEARRRFSENGS